ncbi:hypothetical protein Mapa_014956 [Marchantia paleacea]|nr:hypothetical protein Mapa_014956 [Marchantia paleacea]
MLRERIWFVNKIRILRLLVSPKGKSRFYQTFVRAHLVVQIKRCAILLVFHQTALKLGPSQVGKLESTMLKEQQAEKHIAALEGEVGQLTDIVQNRTAEVSNTCGLLEVLSRERDHLQSELNNLRENFSLEEATRNRLEELWNSKSSEHRAAAEELAALKCDYQLLKTDLVQLNEGNALLMADLRNITDKANKFHQALIVREKEQENIFHLYESVCDENHHLKVAVYEIENQIQQQMFHQENMEGMLRKADEQVKALVEENERVVSELKVLSNVRNEQLGTDVYSKWSSPKFCGTMPHVQLFILFLSFLQGLHRDWNDKQT